MYRKSLQHSSLSSFFVLELSSLSLLFSVAGVGSLDGDFSLLRLLPSPSLSSATSCWRDAMAPSPSPPAGSSALSFSLLSSSSFWEEKHKRGERERVKLVYENADELVLPVFLVFSTDFSPPAVLCRASLTFHPYFSVVEHFAPWSYAIHKSTIVVLKRIAWCAVKCIYYSIATSCAISRSDLLHFSYLAFHINVSFSSVPMVLDIWRKKI